MIPQILSRQYKFFVQDKEMLCFSVRPIVVARKTPPMTSELALEDGDVIDIQGLLGYLVCNGKDNYIVHLVLRRQEKIILKSYESSSSLLMKEESSTE